MAKKVKSKSAFNLSQYVPTTAFYEAEKFEPKAYYDKIGKAWTIGYGTNLDEPTIQSYLKSKGYDVNALKSGKKKITEKEGMRFLEDKMHTAYDDARKLVKNFEELPDELKYVMTDMAYNIGATRLQKFKKLRAALEQGDYETAGKEFQNSRLFGQIGRRGRAHLGRFEEAAKAKLQPQVEELPVEEPGLYTKARTGFAQVAPFIPGGELLNKVLPYAQGGKVDKYKSIPRTGLRYPKIVNLPSGKRSYYSPEDETIYMAAGEDPTVMQHEMFHHWQNLNNELSVGPVAKAPMMAQNPGDWYNRRQADMQDASSKFLKKNPSFVNVPFNLLYDKEVEPAMYNYPEYAEGEAEEYQNYVRGGGEPLFPEYGRGGLIKRKDGSYSKRGLWDNIRANRGSKKKPTKEMLRQERKIRAAEKKEDGGEITMNPYLPNTPLATGAVKSVMGPIDYALLPSQLPIKAASALGRGAITAAEILNPLGGLRPSPNMMYRGIGKEGFEDVVQSGVLRPAQHSYPAKRSLKEIVNSPKQFDRTYYTPDANVAMQYGQGYVAAVPKNSAEFVTRYNPNKPWSQSTSSQIPINIAELYRQYPIVGYKKILKREDGGPVYNWIPPNYPRVGARNEQGGWLDQYADGGDVPHDYMYSQDNVSSYRPGTSIHPTGMTNVPDSPCGPGFTIQYDETGNPVCMPIAELVSTAPTAPTPVLAGASQMDYDLFNPAVYNQSPLETYSIERTTRGRNKEERFKPTKEERQATRKAIKASSLHRRPFLSGVRQFFRNVGDIIERCLPGDDCYKFEDGSWVTNSSIPTPTTPSYYPAGPDRTLTNYQMGTPKAPMYAHGATVWNKRLADEQMSADYVVGPDTKGTQVKNTYPDRMSGAENTTNYKIGDYIPTGMDYKSPAAGTYDYNKDVQPYYTMRLHAPDTRRMAYGGYVPRYDFGSFITDVGKLGLNTLAAPLEQISGNNFVNFNYNNKSMADAAAVSEGVLGAATDIVGTTFAGPVYGMAKGQVQGITKGLGTSTEEQRGANKWANKTGQIVGSTGDLIAGIASGNPQQIVGGAGNLLGTAGGQLGSKELGMVGQLAGLSSSFINPAASTNSFGKVPQLGGTGDLVSGSGMLMAKHGGRIPGLRWQQLNPGVSAPKGVYTGPTNQRGITFANGGDVRPYITSDPKEFAKLQKLRDDSLALFNSAYNFDNELSWGKDEHGHPEGLYGNVSFEQLSPFEKREVKEEKIYVNNPNKINKNIKPIGREYMLHKWGASAIDLYKKPIQKVILEERLPMRGISPLDVGVEADVKGRPTYRNWNTGEVMYDIPEHLKIGSNWRTPQPSKKKNGGWLDSYEEGGEVDITKPYLNPATVQATLASANKPVTNTLGRVISTSASREKERREKIIAKDESKYSVEDYKKGIQEPGLEDATLEAIDALSMLSGAGYLGKKGVELGIKEIGKGVKNLIYKGVDPMFYNPSEKIKSFVPNLLSTEKDKIKRIEKIMRDSEVRGSYRKAHNRLDAWRVGLGLPQKYNTFKKTGENTFAINPELFRLNPDEQQSIIAHVKAFNLKDKYLNNIITSEQYEKGLVNINKKMHDRLDDRFSARWIKEQNIPFQPKAIVERKGDKGFSMYDQDRYAGVMGGFRWDVEDLPGNKTKLTAKDTWDLYPFEKRGVTKLSDLTSLERQKELNKGYIPALKNVEVLKLVGGKPYNIENTFIIDKYKQGGWLDNL